LLGVDPYDEAAHRELVGLLTETGRHGEGRRAQTRYVQAMREIGVEIA
jgi:DNA-binding SARP family transcriptional activator